MQQFNIALTLVLCGLYATSVAADDCSVDGYFANPSDTGKYFQCFKGQRYDYKCIQDYVFVKVAHMCVYPDYVSESEKYPAYDYAVLGPMALGGSSAITADCPNGDGTYAVEGDCRKYFYCGAGIRTPDYDCGSGMKSTNIPYQYCVVAAAGECY